MTVRQLLSTVSSLALALGPAVAYANPTGGNVVAGDATIVQESPDTLVVKQNSGRAIINWTDFSIGETETTRFDQPSSSSVALNRVTGTQVSQILGNLQANGKVYLVNPNGVVFGQNAQVDVSGLVATTANITDSNFMNAQDVFDHAGLADAAVTNAGTITAKDGGLVALVAPVVKNSGTITAKLGTVTLAGGQTFTLDLYGDQLVALAVEDDSLEESLAENSGTISAQGGYIVLTAGQAKEALNNVVNMNGYVQADTLETTEGRIVLGSSNGYTHVAGTAAANGADFGERGGTVDILGQKVAVRDGATVQANGAAGGGDIHIGGDYQGGGALAAALRTLVENGVTLEANATDNGDGGEIVVWADEITGFGGHAEAQGGANGGDGGFVEVSGKDTLVFEGTVDTTAARGERGMLLLDPANITIYEGFGQADDGQLGDGAILEADGGGGDFAISEVTLEVTAASTDITLEATDNITLNDLSDDSLTLTTTGDVIFKADSDNNGVGDFTMNTGDTIATGGANIAISGANLTVGNINTSNGMNGNVTLTGTLGTTLNGDISTYDGNLIVNGNLALTNDVTYSTGAGAGSAIFSGDISGNHTLNLDMGSTGNVTFQNVDIDTLTFSSGNNINLNGTLETDSAQVYSVMTGVMTLTGDSALYARDGGVTQNITMPATMDINGAYALDVLGYDLTLKQMGNSSPLASITVTADNLLDLGNSITTTGAQSFTGNSINLSGNLTTTDNNITLTGPTTLATAVVINTGTGLGDIDFTDTVDGGFGLTLSAGTGDITLGGIAGGGTALTNLTASGTNLDLSYGVTTLNAQDYTGLATIGGNFATTNSNIDFSSAVTLAALTDVDTGAGAGNVDFASTIDGSYGLSVDAGTGTTIFGDAVGGSTPLQTLSANGNTVAVGDVTTSGAQDYTGAMDLSGDLTVGTGSLVVTGDVTLLNDSVLTSGGGVSDPMTITGDVLGDHTLELVAGTGDITLGNVDVDTLTLTSGDDLAVGTAITTDTAQDYTNMDVINLTGNTTFTADDAGTAQNITFDAANIITASGDVTIDGDTVTLYQMSGLQNLDVTGNTAVLLNNDLTSTGTMIFNGGATSLGGTLTTSAADITFNSGLTLTGDSTLDTGLGLGTVTLANVVDGAYDLTATAGTGDFVSTGDIGGVTPLVDLTVTAANIGVNNVTTTGLQTYNGQLTSTGVLTAGLAIDIIGDVILGGGAGTTSGAININGDVTLTADSILQTGGTLADTITISGDVSGDYDLTMGSGLADIDIAGTMDINQWILTSGGDLTLGGGSFVTDGAMDFTNVGAITLSADTAFTASDGATAQDITLGPSNSIMGPHHLSFVGDDVILYDIGSAADITQSPLTLDVNANAFYLYGGVYTQYEQNYTSLNGLANDLVSNNSDITINSDLTLLDDVLISTGSGAGDVIFGGTIDGNYDLIINAGEGLVVTNYNLGDTIPLASLAFSGARLDLQDVTTVGTQTYTGPTTLNGDLTSRGGGITFNDAVTLMADIAMSSGSAFGGDLVFNDAIDGPYDLTLTAGSGDIAFNAAVGVGTRLGTLTLTTMNDLIMGEGARVTRFVQSGATGETLIVGDNPGLDSLQGISIATPSYIQGRLTSSEIYLASAGTMDVEVYTDSLTIGGQGSHITGLIAGRGGYTAARAVKFNGLSGGPHSMNGYNIPLLDDITAQQVLNMTRLAARDTPLAVTTNFTEATTRELNPFSGDYTLIVADETGLLGEDYLSGLLWDEDEYAISTSVLDVEFN